MPRPTVSGRDASNKRDAIVAAAVRSFAAHGVARTSMRRIAKAVGITDATLYHYFTSKQALLEAAFRSATFQTDDLEAALEGTAGSLRERLRAAGRAFLDVLAWNEEWTRLVVRESLRPASAGEGAIGSLVGALGRQRIDALHRQPADREEHLARAVCCLVSERGHRDDDRSNARREE